MSKLEELIAELEKAAGPNYELDRLITEVSGYPNIYRHEDGHIPSNSTFPNFTASIDAAVALVNRVLPGWCWYAGNCPADFLDDKSKPFSAELMGPVTYGVVDPEVGEEPIYDTACAWAVTPALALCIAALRAKLAQEEA